MTGPVSSPIFAFSTPPKKRNRSPIEKEVDSILQPPPFPTKKNLKKRKVFTDTSQAASVKEFPSDYATYLQDHASSRVEISGVVFCCYDQAALRSDGSLRNITFSVGPAALQIGKGEKTLHAAHPNSASGLEDNLCKLYAEEIYHEKKVTPLKRRKLTSMGIENPDALVHHSFKAISIKTSLTYRALKCASEVFSSKTITKKNKKILRSLGVKDVESVTSLKTLEEIEEAIFNAGKGVKRNILSGTSIEFGLNMTNLLPKEVNLLVDAKLEKKVRPEYAKILKQIAEGLHPQAGSLKYKTLIREHLSQTINKIENLIALMDATFPQEKKEQLLHVLFAHQNELIGTSSLPDHFFEMPDTPHRKPFSLANSGLKPLC